MSEFIKIAIEKFPVFHQQVCRVKLASLVAEAAAWQERSISSNGSLAVAQAAALRPVPINPFHHWIFIF